jgi:hypothetical protein
MTGLECEGCTELRRLLAQWVVENKRLKLELEERTAQSDSPQGPDHIKETEGSPSQNKGVAYPEENRRSKQTSE